MEILEELQKMVTKEIVLETDKQIMLSANSAMIIPLQIEKIKFKPGLRKLKAGWKTWYCSKCGLWMIYKGKLPKHTNCKKMEVLCGIDTEQELVSCVSDEIKKEIRKVKHESRTSRNHAKCRKSNRGCRKNVLSKRSKR